MFAVSFNASSLFATNGTLAGAGTESSPFLIADFADLKSVADSGLTQSTFTDAGWNFEEEATNGNNDYWIISSTVNDGYPSFTGKAYNPAKSAVIPVTSNCCSLTRPEANVTRRGVTL